MQRSMAPMLYCKYMRPYRQQIVKTFSDKQMRMVSTKGGKGNYLLSNKTSSSVKKIDSIDGSAFKRKNNEISHKELSFERLSNDQLSFNKRMRKDLQPRVTREENMWRDPQQMDTKWLHPRDPSRYKPNFKNTEPHSLRKQFMRSPDERSRDVLSRDWENAVKTFQDNQRQNAYLSSNASTQVAYETNAESILRQSRANLRYRNILIGNEEKLNPKKN